MGERHLARTIMESFDISDGKLVCILKTVILFNITGDKGPSLQYQAVLQHKDQLEKSLADGPDQHLLNQFKLRGWLGPEADASAPEMIDEALSRIQSNVSNYAIFIEMLPDTESVKAIVDAITGMVYSCIILLSACTPSEHCIT